MSFPARPAAFLAVAFGWTWLLWVGGYLSGQAAGVAVDTGATVFDLAGRLGTPGFGPQVLFFLAVFGPLLGYLVARRYRPFWGAITRPILVLAVAVPVVSIFPAFVLTVAAGTPAAPIGASSALVAIGLYFVSNLATSGTEEFGWRGYLYPILQVREPTFWGAAWKGGLIWAIWHFPLVILLYRDSGFLVVPALVGTTAGIVAMSYITNFVYERSNSLALAMLLHALNNTSTFALVLLYPGTPFTLVSPVMAWAFVAYIEKAYQVDAKPR